MHLQSSTGTRRLEMLNYHARDSKQCPWQHYPRLFPFFLKYPRLLANIWWKCSNTSKSYSTSKQYYLSKINNIVLLNASKSTSKRGTLTAYRLDDDRCWASVEELRLFFPFLRGRNWDCLCRLSNATKIILIGSKGTTRSQRSHGVFGVWWTKGWTRAVPLCAVYYDLQLGLRWLHHHGIMHP